MADYLYLILKYYKFLLLIIASYLLLVLVFPDPVLEPVDENYGCNCQYHWQKVRQRPLPEVPHLSVAEEAFAEVNDGDVLELHLGQKLLKVKITYINQGKKQVPTFEEL